MTDLASPVVQVVTTGTDWPAVWAAISGGVVGLAGIIFAWRQSRMTISAEDARAKLAEKRRIYANCLTAINTYLYAAGALAGGTELPPAEHAGLEQEADRARTAALNTTSEVYLVGTAEVTRLANRTLSLVMSAETGTSVEEPVTVFVELTGAMRRDLGENPAVQPTIQTASNH